MANTEASLTGDKIDIKTLILLANQKKASDIAIYAGKNAMMTVNDKTSLIEGSYGYINPREKHLIEAIYNILPSMKEKLAFMLAEKPAIVVYCSAPNGSRARVSYSHESKYISLRMLTLV